MGFERRVGGRRCKNNERRAPAIYAHRENLTLVRSEGADGDLRWLGRGNSRWLLKEALKRLEQDPTVETRNMKTLRGNTVAQRELRIHGKYRILFNVDLERRTVTILVVAIKRHNVMYVRGQRFSACEDRM